tara:strand:+ start:626 stop:934 length:309 start_codon:yes stop_codon:yes gene_type:complete
MADQIKHGTTEIVDASSVLKKAALADSGVTAGGYAGGNTHVPSITVDVKGFVTSATRTAVKMTGIDFLASGNTLQDQTIFVNTSAPSASDGVDGDVWYHTIS